MKYSHGWCLHRPCGESNKVYADARVVGEDTNHGIRKLQNN